MTGMRRSARGWLPLGAALVLLALSASAAVAQTCPARDPKPKVVGDWRVQGSFARDLADTLAVYFLSLVGQAVPEINLISTRELAALLVGPTIIEQLGFAIGDLQEIARAFGTEFTFILQFNELPSLGRRLTGKLVNTRTEGVVRAFEQALPQSDDAALDVVETLAAQTSAGLWCDIVDARLRPVRPVLALEVTEVVQAGTQATVRVTLTDAEDGLPQPGKDVTIEHAAVNGALSSVTATTNFFGVAEVDLPVGTVPGLGIVQAHFRREDGLPADSPFGAYRVVNPGGDLTVEAPQASLRVGEGETVTARLRRNGTPAAGEPITFTAAGGSVAAPVVTTDIEGQASTAYEAPATNAMVDVTVTTPAPVPPGPPAPTPPDLTASLTFVVDGAVAFNLSAADTLQGGATSVIADLSVGGAVQAAIPVTFNLTGPGVLNATAAQTDSAGRAEVIYFAPAADTSVTVTAEAVVDGQSYTRTVTINVGAVVRDLTVRLLPVLEYPELFGATRFYAATRALVHDDPIVTITMGGPISPECPLESVAPAECWGMPTPPPVTLRAEDPLSQVEWTVSQPLPNVVGWDVSASSTPPAEGTQSSVLLELTFRTAGQLHLQANPSWGTVSAVQVLTAPYPFQQILGAIHGAGGPMPARDATVAIQEPGTRTIFLNLATEFSGGGSGRALTLTFTPSP